MLHHVLLEVSDLERSASFYDALLAPLGWRRHFEEDGKIGWGIAKPVFFAAAHHEPKPGFGLLSFSALGIVAVKAAWEGGMRAGGTNVSDPGEQYNLIADERFADRADALRKELDRLQRETDALPDAMPLDEGIKSTLPDAKIR